MLLNSTDLPSILDEHQTHQIYNALDAALTLEIFEELSALPTSPESQLMYDFSRAVQAPALEMMLRGIRVDNAKRWAFIHRLEEDEIRVQEILDEFATAIWGTGLNPRSPKQLKEFFYSAMGYPQQFKFFKGERKLSTDREALEKLAAYFHTQPLINCILKLRDLRKKSSILRSEVDEASDGSYRMHTSYNVVGTETNRWSSSKNVEGGGTNLQNLTEELRRIFIADPGRKLAYIDLSQAESRAVGFLCWTIFGRSAYLDASESGDLHTSVARLVWPRMPWTEDPSHNRALAERPFYRHFSYRDMAKRAGHATNYYGQPFTVSKNLKVPQELIESFRRDYFHAFPELQDYHRFISRELQLSGQISTPLGTTRTFFGRRNDDATLREAIAHVPQHMVGVLLNLALWRVWHHLGKEVDILAQVHDAILIQYHEERETELISRVLPLMVTPLQHGGRTMFIPSDVAVGWNWSKYSASNPDGLKHLALGEADGRVRRDSPTSDPLSRLVA